MENLNGKEKRLVSDIIETEPIWYQQPSVLFSIDKIIKFFPDEDDSYNEKMNSVVRFSIYLSVILIIIKNNYLYLYIFLITCLVTFLLSKNNSQNENLTNKKNEKISCEEPTVNNPFMNVLMSDYKYNPKRKACTINKSVEKEMSKKFNHNLYKDVGDVYQKSNSQRQYYTMPSTTIPNDQSSFARWLYKVPTSCKSGDGNQCFNLQNPSPKCRLINYIA